MVNHFLKSSLLNGTSSASRDHESSMDENKEKEMAEQIVVDAGTVDQITGPRITIVNQGCVMNENFSRNGVTKQVHVVVKNLAFQLELESSIDLTKANLAAKLIYDFDRDDEPKIEVSYVKNEPLEYKVNILDSGSKAIIELKIKVLTSQHEDMLFRVQMFGTDPMTLVPFEVLSKPIKVISKLTQGSTRKSQSTASVATTSPTLTASTPNKKRVTQTDSISVQLQKIEDQGQTQLGLLNAIARKLLFEESLTQSGALQVLTNAVSQHAINMEENNDPSQMSHDMQDKRDSLPDAMESAFRRFVSAACALNAGDVHSRIVGVLSSLAPADAERIADILSSVIDTHTRKRVKLDHTQN